MIRVPSRLVRLVLLVVLAGAAQARTTGDLFAQAPPNPPMAKKDPKTITLHGMTLVDDYHWLREKGAAEVALPPKDLARALAKIWKKGER